MDPSDIEAGAEVGGKVNYLVDSDEEEEVEDRQHEMVFNYALARMITSQFDS